MENNRARRIVDVDTSVRRGLKPRKVGCVYAKEKTGSGWGEQEQEAKTEPAFRRRNSI